MCVLPRDAQAAARRSLAVRAFQRGGGGDESEGGEAQAAVEKWFALEGSATKGALLVSGDYQRTTL